MIAQIQDVKTSPCRGNGDCHSIPKNKQKLHQIAQEVLDKAGLAGKLYPEERDFISTASRLIVPLIQDYLSRTGGQAPPLASVRDWFYRGCPDWAIAILTDQIQQK
ncbi:hypothetical protein A6S26_05465 [Nostoc sp. ATCC 43529]|nr:hypothetical protein A6S26_05465 [Nostoc sp. ATCC 43529]